MAAPHLLELYLCHALLVLPQLTVMSGCARPRSRECASPAQRSGAALIQASSQGAIHHLCIRVCYCVYNYPPTPGQAGAGARGGCFRLWPKPFQAMRKPWPSNCTSPGLFSGPVAVESLAQPSPAHAGQAIWTFAKLPTVLFFSRMRSEGFLFS